MYKDEFGHMRWGRVAIHFIYLTVVILAVFAGFVYEEVRDTLKTTHHTVNVQNIREEAVDISEGEPLNVLLLGKDGANSEEGEGQRTDTLMIVSVNPEEGITRMLSIPRDTYTYIDGQPGPDKINHAYAFGGPGLTIQAVQEFLDIPIDYYAEVDMSGLVEIIDGMGGIEITSPLTFNYDDPTSHRKDISNYGNNTQFNRGETRHANGYEAMCFARMRYDDPRGEMGRQDRQKLVIKAMLDKLISFDSDTEYREILKVVAKFVKTDFDLTQALKVYPKYVDALEKFEKVEFSYIEDLNIDGIYYLYIPLAPRVKAANEMRSLSHLDRITASQLVDPLGAIDPGETSVTRANTVVLNQYPSAQGEDLEYLYETQGYIQQIRQEEYYVPAAPATYYEEPYYNYQVAPYHQEVAPQEYIQ